MALKLSMSYRRVWIIWGVIGSVWGGGWLEEYENSGQGCTKSYL